MWLFFFWWSGPAGRRGCPQQRDLSRQTRCCRNQIKKNKVKRTRSTCLGGPLLLLGTHAHMRGKSGNTWKMFLSRRCTRVRIQSRRRGIDAMKSPKLNCLPKMAAACSATCTAGASHMNSLHTWKTEPTDRLVEPDTGQKKSSEKIASRNSTCKAASKTLHCGAWHYSCSRFTALRSAPRSSTWQQTVPFFQADDFCVVNTVADRDSPH